MSTPRKPYSLRPSTGQTASSVVRSPTVGGPIVQMSPCHTPIHHPHHPPATICIYQHLMNSCLPTTVTQLLEIPHNAIHRSIWSQPLTFNHTSSNLPSTGTKVFLRHPETVFLLEALRPDFRLGNQRRGSMATLTHQREVSNPDSALDRKKEEKEYRNTEENNIQSTQLRRSQDSLETRILFLYFSGTF